MLNSWFKLTSSLQQATTDHTLSCESCNAVIGKLDPFANGFHIYKWALSITNRCTPSQPSTFPLSNFITAHLLSHVSAQAVHKFVLYAPPTTSGPEYKNTTPSSPIIHIWVFAPYLITSSSTSFSPANSSSSPPKPQPVSKIFYRTITPSILDKLLENTSIITAIEEIILPSSVMFGLERVLRESTVNLPPSAQRFQDWSVGLLGRYLEV
jgi:hypothetical protein